MQSKFASDGSHERFRSRESIGCSLQVDFGIRIVRPQPESFRATESGSQFRINTT